jgi:replicative DNA helicase
MRIEKKNNDTERRILIGMIVDSVVLGRIHMKWRPKSFKSKWANIIAQWCLNYYERYDKAPMRNIESLFEHWSEKTSDETTVNLVSKFLASLSDEYADLKQESNGDYLIDIAARYFNQVLIERLMEDVEENISVGRAERAHDLLISYNKYDMGVGEGIDVLHDTEAMREAFNTERNETLIQFPGALGKFFRDTLERGNFVSFMGKKGVGKSWWLLNMAFQAMLQRRKVAMFELGDMGKKKTMRRLMIRVTKHPRYAEDVYVPTKIWYDKKKRKVQRDFELKEFTKRLSWRRAKKECEKIMTKSVKSKESYFKLSCHHNSTLSVDGISSVLQDWERIYSWTPDVIVIDYADILSMQYRGIEGRDSINETWKRLRTLSQRQHALVVTATQSDAASYDKGTLGMGNFSDDRRKIDSVRGMVGINQTEREKKRGLMRLNWISLDDGDFQQSACVHVAGCLAIGNPAVKSCF